MRGMVDTAYCVFLLAMTSLDELCFEIGHRPFDFFLPNPSLSITSSAHRIRLLSTGSARNRSVTVAREVEGLGAEVVWVWVVVVEGAVKRERVWVERAGILVRWMS